VTKQISVATFVAAAACLGMFVAAANCVAGPVLVGNVFVTGYDGWADKLDVVPAAGPLHANWGVLLTGDKCLSESSDGRVTTSTVRGSGLVKGFNMVNDVYTTPGTSGDSTTYVYHIKGTLSTSDNDGFGLLFGYQDESNYYRVSFRQQANGNLGYVAGTSIQKVVNGVVSQAGTTSAFIPTVDNAPFSVDISVNQNTYTISVNGTLLTALSGTEVGSTLLTTNNKYGIHSWYQQVQDIATFPTTVYCRGTELRALQITDGAGSVLKNHTFSGALAANWKALIMTNGTNGTGISPGNTEAAGRMRGNFHQDFRNGTIVDDTNGYVWATSGKANIDFIGPSVIIDDPDSGNWGNYEMKVRLSTADNDGIGLLLRATTDGSGNATAFYRINFANEAMGTGVTRCPRGMSIQKYLNGTWSEIFRDNQTTPLFVYTVGTAFDVKADVVGNAISVQVTQGATVYDYGTKYDISGSPILSGSVGFTNFGCGDTTDQGVVYSAYGGDANIPLLAVPEPSSMIMLGIAALCSLLLWRRKR
jgi:hypothetical protein